MDKAPLESYADVGGLDQQIQEIKEAVELPLTHPELYEDIGIKPPKAGPFAELGHPIMRGAFPPLCAASLLSMQQQSCHVPVPRGHEVICIVLGRLALC